MQVPHNVIVYHAYKEEAGSELKTYELGYISPDGKTEEIIYQKNNISSLYCNYCIGISEEGSEFLFLKNNDIYVTDSNFNNMTCLTSGKLDMIDDKLLRTFGEKIVFSGREKTDKGKSVSTSDGYGTIFIGNKIIIMNRDGTGLKTLCQGKEPFLNSYTKEIVYMEDYYTCGEFGSYGSMRVCLINTDGTGYKNLTMDNDYQTPSMNKDASRLAFYSPRNHDRTIWLYNLNKKGYIALSKGGFNPCFSPDGKDLSFWNEEGIYIAPVNGKGQRKKIKSWYGFICFATSWRW